MTVSRSHSWRWAMPACLALAFVALLLFLAAGPGASAADAETVAVKLAPQAWQSVRTSLQPLQTWEYGSFVWLELTPADYEQLQDSGIAYQPQGDVFTIDLGGQRFDPRRGDPALPAGWGEVRADAADLHLVQFTGPTRAEWLDSLEQAGFEVVQYIHPHTYVVWGQEPASLRTHTFVRWTGPFAPAYRVLPPWRNLPEAAIQVDVLLYRGADRSAAMAAIAELGGRSLGSRVLNQTWEIAGFTLSGANLQAAAQVAGVYSIQPVPTNGGLRGEMSNQINVGNYDGSNQAFPGYLDWLASAGVNGAGVIIANVDGGVDHNHADLVNRMVACTGVTCSGTSSDHGTHTAGIMAADGASGVMLDGFLRGLGMAPGASLVEQVYSPWFTQPGGMLLLMTDSYNNGASISGNSWGPSGSPLGYDDDTLQVDIGVRDADPDAAGNQPLNFVLSFMNGGGGTSTQGTPDEGKNIFTIGSTKMQMGSGQQILEINDLSSNTAHGPALDGRKIPHMVAPGCDVDSSVPGGYALFCGTSMASPHVSGAVALFIEYYRNLSVEGGADPSPALVKAAFLPVSHDLAGHDDADGNTLGHPFDSKQGWGRMDTAAVISPTVEAHYFDNPVLLDNTGEVWQQSLYVVDPSKPFKVMLVWTDAPGHGLGGSTPAWNNNLDLEVVYGGNTYRGNIFDANGWSQTGGTADDRNNTEGVFLGPTAAGSVLVRVSAANINSDGVPNTGDDSDQDFALVCYNCTTLLSPSELHVHVQNSSNNPIQGAYVVATTGTMTETYSGSTNAQGNLLLLVEEGTYTVTAEAFGYLPNMTNATTISGTQTAVTLTLTAAPSFTLDGQVTDQTTGAPLVGATVRVDGTPLITQTDANGEYEFTIPQGSYDMTVSAPLHQTETRAITINGNSSEDFALVATTTDGLLYGHVYDDNTDLPIEGATVTIQGGGSDTTDENGYYEIQEAPGTYTVEASAPLYSDVAINGVVIAQSNLTELDIYLPTASISLPAEPVVAYVEPNSSLNVALRVHNNGDGALEFEVSERDGGFDPALRAPSILLVDDDDNSPDVRGYYTDALDALGYDYDVVDVTGSNNGPNAATMDGYDVVVWFSGDKFGTSSAGPNSTDEAQLAIYLDGGGKLFLSSQDYHYDMGQTAFMQDYLGVGSISDDTGDYASVTGQNEFSGLGPYGLAYPGSNYADIITAGTAEVSFAGGNDTAGLFNDNTVFFAFPWEAIANDDAGSGEESLDAILQYLGGGDIPWLTVTPITGTVPANSYLDIELGFSSFPPTYTILGVYTGTIRFNSNDPANEQLDLDVWMNVVSETFEIAVTKEASVSEAQPGDIFTYTIQRQLTMSGENSYEEAIYDEMPAGLTVLPDSIMLNGTPMPGLYDSSNNAISGTISTNFTDNHAYTLTFQVEVDNDVVSGTVASNTSTHWVSVNGGPMAGPYSATAGDVTFIVPPGLGGYGIYLPIIVRNP
jgi:serine protease AprX